MLPAHAETSEKCEEADEIFNRLLDSGRNLFRHTIPKDKASAYAGRRQHKVCCR